MTRCIQGILWIQWVRLPVTNPAALIFRIGDTKWQCNQIISYTPWRWIHIQPLKTARKSYQLICKFLCFKSTSDHGVRKLFLAQGTGTFCLHYREYSLEGHHECFPVTGRNCLDLFQKLFQVPCSWSQSPYSEFCFDLQLSSFQKINLE